MTSNGVKIKELFTTPVGKLKSLSALPAFALPVNASLNVEDEKRLLD
ncbi:MAG: hypothetical protein ACE5D0_05530 [Fidelibacterota bacterium]